MKVENMLKITEEFDYKSLSKKLEVQLDKVIAENERLRKAFDDHVERRNQQAENRISQVKQNFAEALEKEKLKCQMESVMKLEGKLLSSQRNHESGKRNRAVNEVATATASELTRLKELLQNEIKLRMAAEEEVNKLKSQSTTPQDETEVFDKNQTVWSDEDEIALLQGFLDYKTNTGKHAHEDLSGFYEVVRKSISVDLSKIEVFKMLQTLQKKYERNLSKGKIGEEPIFGLSKSVWGELGYLAGKRATVAKPQDHVFDVPKPAWRAPRYKNRTDGGGEKKSSGGKETNETCVWSDEDETALLQGLIDFKTNTGTHAFKDMSGFYEVVRKSVRVDVRKIEVIEKLRTLRLKFESNLGQGKKGEEPTFVKRHDRDIFVLSKSIWGLLYYSGEAPTFAKPEVFDLSKPVWKDNRDVKRRCT